MAIGAQGLNAITSSFDEPFGVYLAGILWLLFGAGFMFMRLLSVVRPERRSPESAPSQAGVRPEASRRDGSTTFSEA